MLWRGLIHEQACELAIGANRQPCGLPAERATALTEKERVRLRFHSRTLGQPGLDRAYLVPPKRVRRRESLFQARDVEHAAFNVHLGQAQPAGLGHAQAMPEHEQE